MTSTIRIKAAQAKAGDVRVLADGTTRRIVKVDGSRGLLIALEYEDGFTLHTVANDPAITIELPETHPIAVLERQLERVEAQFSAAQHEWLEALRLNEDKDLIIRRTGDRQYLNGRRAGLRFAIGELRAGIEAY